MGDEKSSSLIKGMGVYAIGTFGTKILSFLIVPLYTYYIATSDMGVYDVINSTISLLIPIITMQLFDASYRWIIQEDILDKERYIRATVQVLLFNSLVSAAIVGVIHNYYAIPYCSYFCVALGLSIMLQAVQKLLRGLKKQWLFAVSGIAYTLVFLVCNVVQICILKMGVVSLFQSTIIATIVTLVMVFVLEPRLRINYFKKTEISLVIQLYKFSVPLVPNYLNWWVVNSSDRYIVLFYLGSAANGLLAVAHKFPSMLQSILGLFTSAWQDVSIAENEKSSGEYYTNLFKTYYTVSFSLLWAVIPATKIVMDVVLSEAYRASSNYVAFYYLGTVFQAFASFYGVGYMKSAKTSRAFTTSVYGAVVNAVVNIGLIHFVGLQAAAVSTFIGFFVMWFVRERQNRDDLGIKLNWIQFFSYTGISVAVSIISIYTGLMLNLLLAVCGTILFVYLNKKMVWIIIKKVSSRFT